MSDLGYDMDDEDIAFIQILMSIKESQAYEYEHDPFKKAGPISYDVPLLNVMPEFQPYQESIQKYLKKNQKRLVKY